MRLLTLKQLEKDEPKDVAKKPRASWWSEALKCAVERITICEDSEWQVIYEIPRYNYPHMAGTIRAAQKALPGVKRIAVAGPVYTTYFWRDDTSPTDEWQTRSTESLPQEW